MRLFKIKHIVFWGLLLCTQTSLYSQNKADPEKIAASQGGASPLAYNSTNKDIPTIEPGNYNNEKECTPRMGLPKFFSKIDKGEDVAIAFIGGSITQGEYCYRLQISKYLENIYPDSRIKWINAGVSGTGTDLGAFRIQEQVLQYNPDLLFIEFAVNGGYPDAMEGMIRKIVKRNPYTDICLIYTISNGQTVAYQREDVPQVIKRLDDIAGHYKIPSIHLGMEASQLEKDGKLLWKGKKEEAEGKILFSNDGVHPITEGGNLYAAAIARGMAKIKKVKNTSPKRSHPQPLISAEWENAEMYEPSQIAKFDANWKKIKTNDNFDLKKFNGWFDTVMTSDKEGASFSFIFNGDIFGMFDIGGPEVGQVKIVVDGKPVKLKKQNITGVHLFEASEEIGDSLLNRFNFYCNNRYRGQYDIVKLEKGIHHITVSISPDKADKKKILGEKQQDDITQNSQKYDRTAIYLGRILLRGKPLAKPVPQRINPAQQEKWEQKVARYEEQDRGNPPKDDVILFVGSSTVENWKSLKDDFPGKNVLNRGISGTKTIDLFDYKERVIWPYNPKQIFVYEGDNDIGYKWPPEQTLIQFKELFSAIRKEKPEAQIVFISIKPSPRRLKDAEQIVKTNALIKDFIEQQPNADYADVYTPMHTADGKLYPEHYREDGLHLTAEGYKVWKEVISNFIK